MLTQSDYFVAVVGKNKEMFIVRYIIVQCDSYCSHSLLERVHMTVQFHSFQVASVGVNDGYETV